MLVYPLPIPYDQPLYRPPSEADSLILQATLGCSWNRCSFCEMYTSKRFRPRAEAELFAEIRAAGAALGRVRRVFLADGDAMVLSTRRLLRILERIRADIGGVQRVSCYALPRQLAGKSAAELGELRAAGLSLVYVGVESGDDEVLRRVRKGETMASTIEGLAHARAAGLRVSAMILNGLGGVALSAQHARHSAEVLNETQPEYAAVLVVMLPPGEERFRAAFGPDYREPSQRELLQELETFVAATELESTIFRSDHASNYLVLKGVLGKDKARLLGEIREALAARRRLRPEHARGL